MESYCTLELKRRPYTDVQVKVCAGHNTHLTRQAEVAVQ